MYHLTIVLIVLTCLLPAWTRSIANKTYSQCTEVENEHVTFDWTIRNISLLVNGPGTYILSAPFFTRNNTDKWGIEFYPKGYLADDDSNADASIYLQLLSTEKLNVSSQWKMSVLKSNVTLKTEHEVYTFEELGGYGSRKFIERSKLLQGDDEITIRCELDLPLKMIDVPCEKQEIPEEFTAEMQKHKLADDFRTLFDNMNSSDVTIIAENERFPAHKAALIARSRIFADLLKQSENELNSTNILTIDNMAPNEVRGMLEFIYTDNVTDFEELAHGLLAAADRFELHRLKAMCEEVLYRELNTAQAANTLVFAHLYHSDLLKKFCLKYIAEHLADVVQTSGYKKMTETYPGLLSEVIQSIVKYQNPI